MSDPAPQTPLSELALTPQDAAKLTPAAAKLSYADLMSISAVFADQKERMTGLVGIACCCCCCAYDDDGDGK